MWGRLGAQAYGRRRFGEEVKTEIGFRFVDRHRGEIQIITDEFGQKISALFGRHAQLEPVARAARRQHEVIGGAQFAGGQFLGNEAGGDVVGHTGATVLFLQYKSTKAQLRALLEEAPGHAFFPVIFTVQRHCRGFDVFLRELAGEIAKLTLLLRQTNIEHKAPFSDGGLSGGMLARVLWCLGRWRRGREVRKLILYLMRL